MTAARMPARNLDTVSIGSIVRRDRKAQGLRQEELAAVSRVGIRFIVDLEAGKPTLHLGNALQVLSALGCYLSIATPSGDL